MIEIRGLSIKVRNDLLLDDISLTLQEGRIYSLLGDNGSGKTTLLRALTSYYPDYQGSILYGGRELRSYSRKERLFLHAILPQSPPFVDMSVESLLSIVAGGIDELSSFDLSHLRKRRVSTLSGGEREMVYLAFLLSRKALLYAFDEVEANLDARYRRKAEEAMLKLKGEKRVVISSFHDINRALAVSDEVIVLNRGKVIFTGSCSAFLDNGNAERCLGLKLSVLTDQDGTVRKMLF